MNNNKPQPEGVLKNLYSRIQDEIIVIPAVVDHLWHNIRGTDHLMEIYARELEVKDYIFLVLNGCIESPNIYATFYHVYKDCDHDSTVVFNDVLHTYEEMHLFMHSCVFETKEEILFERESPYTRINAIIAKVLKTYIHGRLYRGGPRLSNAEECHSIFIGGNKCLEIKEGNI